MLEQRLSKARTALVLDFPFWGSLALRMPQEITTEIPTAATDGARVMFNPEFCGKLSDAELLFLNAHEVMHPLLEHNWRRQGRNHTKWNIAADIVINQLLTQEGVGSMPKGGWLDPDLYKRGGGSSDGVYALLPDKPKPGKGWGNDCLDAPSGSPAEIAAAQAEMKIRVAEAMAAAKAAGKLSKSLETFIKSILQPKADWRTLLADFFERAKVSDRSWARPARRFAAQGMYLPSVSGEALGEIVVGIDCSGSISDDVLAAFAAEVRGIHETGRPEALHVVYFDSKVLRVDTFGPDEAPDLKRYGGGGTAFSPIWREIDKRGIVPVATVVLTDLECSDFGKPPACPVLWASTGHEAAPFGSVCKL